VFISASFLVLVLVLAGWVASGINVGAGVDATAADVAEGDVGAEGATGAAAQPASAVTVAANRARAVLLGVLVLVMARL